MEPGVMLVAPRSVPHGIRNDGGERLVVLAILAPAPERLKGALRGKAPRSFPSTPKGPPADAATVGIHARAGWGGRALALALGLGFALAGPRRPHAAEEAAPAPEADAAEPAPRAAGLGRGARAAHRSGLREPAGRHPRMAPIERLAAAGLELADRARLDAPSRSRRRPRDRCGTAPTASALARARRRRARAARRALVRARRRPTCACTSTPATTAACWPARGARTRRGSAGPRRRGAGPAPRVPRSRSRRRSPQPARRASRTGAPSGAREPVSPRATSRPPGASSRPRRGPPPSGSAPRSTRGRPRPRRRPRCARVSRTRAAAPTPIGFACATRCAGRPTATTLLAAADAAAARGRARPCAPPLRQGGGARSRERRRCSSAAPRPSPRSDAPRTPRLRSTAPPSSRPTTRIRTRALARIERASRRAARRALAARGRAPGAALRGRTPRKASFEEAGRADGPHRGAACPGRRELNERLGRPRRGAARLRAGGEARRRDADVLLGLGRDAGGERGPLRARPPHSARRSRRILRSRPPSDGLGEVLAAEGDDVGGAAASREGPRDRVRPTWRRGVPWPACMRSAGNSQGALEVLEVDAAPGHGRPSASAQGSSSTPRRSASRQATSRARSAALGAAVALEPDDPPLRSAARVALRGGGAGRPRAGRAGRRDEPRGGPAVAIAEPRRRASRPAPAASAATESRGVLRHLRGARGELPGAEPGDRQGAANASSCSAPARARSRSASCGAGCTRSARTSRRSTSRSSRRWSSASRSRRRPRSRRTRRPGRRAAAPSRGPRDDRRRRPTPSAPTRCSSRGSSTSARPDDPPWAPERPRPRGAPARRLDAPDGVFILANSLRLEGVDGLHALEPARRGPVAR